MLLHGLFSDGHVNWIKFGHAAKLAAARFPRDHARPSRPWPVAASRTIPTNYPHGILGRDLEELIAHLGLADYDLGGFSLGARTTVAGGRARGMKPRRAILAGMGLEGLTGWIRRKHFFVDAIDNFETASRGDQHWMAIQFMKTMKVDRVAAALLLPTFTDAHRRMARRLHHGDAGAVRDRGR